MSEFADKTIAVVGLARSGLAAAEVLTERGARVILSDSKPASELPDAVALAERLRLPLLADGAALDYASLDFVVTSPGVWRTAPVLQNAVAAGVPVLGEIEAAYRIARAPILAITGTNGKTTTTVLLGEMLRAAGIETFVAGNIAAGEIALPLIRAAHVAPPDAAIVAEISSFQLEWVSEFRPKVAALLNLSPDHADRQSWDEYVETKFRIFAAQSNDDFAVTPLDVLALVPESPDRSVWYKHEKSDHWWEDSEFPGVDHVWKAGSGLAMRFGEELYVSAPNNKRNKLCQVFDVKLPGAHNLENILAAAAMATAFGVGVEPIRQVATTFTGVVHRLEYVDTKHGVKYINNSMCTNAAAFEKSLEALPERKVVIMGGVFKGGDAGELAQSVVKNNVKTVILIGKSADAIEAACHAAGFTATEQADGMADAVAKAAARATDGETVLLAPACASFDMFNDFEDRGRQFKDAVHKGAVKALD